MNISKKLNPPRMPNFLTFESSGTGLRQDGFKQSEELPVGQLTRDQAIEYGELMRTEFVKHWEKKSNEKN
jgi:hypothetical protein